ncbi:CsgG/HfaB family protein [Candidatus Latescibacterota bacterium]
MSQKLLPVILCVLLSLIGFVQPPLSFAQEKNEFTIAVLDLTANGISQTEARSLSSSLNVQVTRTATSQDYIKKSGISYTVVERTQMDKIFEEFDIQNTGCTDISCAVEFGKMLSVERIIIGSVGLVGETYTINISIVDVESSRTLTVADYKFKGQVDNLLNEGIPDVVSQLLGVKKKSRRTLYIVGGAVLLGGVAAAVLSGGGGGDGGGGTTTGDIIFTIPDPSE